MKSDQLKSFARRVIIVTGMSGAGKSSALNAFEDLGFQTVDNLPLEMIDQLLTCSQDQAHIPIAIGVDSRTLHFSPDHFTNIVTQVRTRPDIDLHILLLDATDNTLVTRFSETRRRHPLAMGQPLRKAIKEERYMMSSVRLHADSILDTSTRTSAETRRVIVKRFGIQAGPKLVVSCMSFGFAYGVPRDSDMVFDVRFLRNPHYEPNLRHQTGQQKEVANFVRADEGFSPFVNRVTDLLDFLLPRYKNEGKSYLTLAFGCTGGKHRSVMTAETISAKLKQAGSAVTLYHRDLPDEIIPPTDFADSLRDTSL